MYNHRWWLPLLAATSLHGAAPNAQNTPFAPVRGAPDCGIQSAIDARASQGGGVVQLPAGEFPLTRYLFLRTGVTLRGAGEGKTILTVGNAPSPHRITGQNLATGTLDVEGDLSSLRPGTTVCLLPYGPGTWAGHMEYPAVQSASGQTITLDTMAKRAGAANQNPYALWGNVTRLAAQAIKGERTIRVTDPGVCKPGFAFTLNGDGDMWGYHYNVVAATTGDTVYLDRPLTVTAPTGSLVNLAFAMITSEKQERLAVEDLTLRGFRTASFQAHWSGFQLAGFHTWACSNVTLRHVTVENWNGDGISIQGGTKALVDSCTARGCAGHGFHPGTGLKTGLFTNILSTGNSGDGVYYCWHNDGVDVVDSVLTNNGSHGVGGLGNPGDVHSTVARNLIADNGLAGIHVYGGPSSGNAIVGNLIRNNSRRKPGDWPGVALYALYQEGSSGCRVAGNTIENTVMPETQWVGIGEQHAKADARFLKNADPATGLFLSDHNCIISNQFRGHKTADILVAGPHTTVGEGQGIVIKREEVK
jgi:hypothetical protein